MSDLTPSVLPEGHVVRMLPAEEWEKLVPLFERSFPGTPVPDPPPFSHALVIQRESTEGEVVFAMFFRLEFHMEPFCADKGYGTYFPLAVALFERMLLDTVVKEAGRPIYYWCTAPRTDEQMERERRLGRTVVEDHVPVVRKLG